MKTNYKIVSLILAIFLLSIGLIYAYNQVVEEAYQQGVQDTILLINQQILNSLNQNGYVPFFYVIGNETQVINLVPYQEWKK